MHKVVYHWFFIERQFNTSVLGFKVTERLPWYYMKTFIFDILLGVNPVKGNPAIRQVLLY